MNSTKKPFDMKTAFLITKNLIVMLVLVVVCIFSSFSWFSHNEKAKASGLSVSCEAPDGIEVAIVEHDAAAPEDEDYSTSVILDESSFLAKLTMSEVTGDGINFYSPALTQMNGVASPDPYKEWFMATPGQDYICFDLYIRTKTIKNIYLDANSNFSTVSERLVWGGGENTQENDNPSSYGYFSRDAVVGSTRASIMGYNSNGELSDRKMLWIPRPDIFLSQSGSNYSLLTGINDNEHLTRTHNYWSDAKEPDTADEAIASVYNSKTDLYNLGQNILITSFDIANEDITVDYDSGYYYVHVVYNTWIEGEDSEARLALSGGRFSINLRLSSDSTKTNV